MENWNKVILDLCGGTGAWSKPYKDAGYKIELITLPTYDVARVYFDSYGMEFKRMDVHYNDSLTVLYEDVFGILAAPPCTEFSLAKGASPRDFATAMETVKACLEIIWQCRIHGNLKFWAVENPRGFLRQFLGIPHFTFEQWQFGDLGIKPTDIWGYFNAPITTVKCRPMSLAVKYKDQHSHGRLMATPKCPDEYRHLNLDRSALRAITPPGFTKAFYLANSAENITCQDVEEAQPSLF